LLGWGRIERGSPPLPGRLVEGGTIVRMDMNSRRRGRLYISLAVLSLAPIACGGQGEVLSLRAGTLEVGITQDGRVGTFSDAESGEEYLPSGMSPALLTLRVAGEDLEPLGVTVQTGDSALVLTFPQGLTATLGIRTRATHATLTLEAVSDPEAVEMAIWGPYPTTIGETIGETVGVVRGGGFAMGIQALNPRTLGGYPWNENDAMPQLDIFESGDYSDLSEEGKRYVLYRVEAAKPDSFGSTLQAYTRSRDEDRVIQNWRHSRYLAPAFEDGGVVGSAIALFGSLEGDALSTLGAIEVAEGLPHPMIDGQWGKEARSASAAYVILPFSESTLDRALDVTLEAGLRYLYHPEPFATWGHFPLNDHFPNGVAGLRRAVTEAEGRGVMLGVHTLSNFITTSDAYVTPEPDPRLAKVGSTTLAADVDSGATEFSIESPDFFNQHDNDELRAALVGLEVVRYREVSETPPWRLLGVERGAFGTTAASHGEGDSIGKLADHAYRVFLTNPALSVEVAANLANLFNEAGLRQISFDGLEGNRSTGMGNYGEILFTTTWYDALSEDVRSHFIADASRTSHYFWHIYTRMNWGEPWYAGFRESQTEYRMKNQAYFRRNYMPGMLGWFRMTPETSVEDMEWMLARSAAYDAGYGFVTSFDALDGNGRTPEILALMSRWEEARMADAFSPDQKARMENLENEFNLGGGGDEGWTLTQIHTRTHRFESRERQPGEPSFQAFDLENPESERPLSFIFTAAGGAVEAIWMELDGVPALTFDGRLNEGEALVYSEGGTASVYSPQWRVLRTVSMDPAAFVAGPGAHRIVVDARLDGGDEAHLKMEFRLSGDPEDVARRSP
jgi:hypothetical protein